MPLFDVNVFMDVLTGRKGVYVSIQLISSVQKGDFPGEISAITIPILWFLLKRSMGGKDAKTRVETLTSGFEVIPTDHAIINASYTSPMVDFEDAIQFHSALTGDSRFLITRNIKDFIQNHPALRVVSPEDFLNQKLWLL